MITISINLLALDRKFFKDGVKKDGSKATYCDIALIETPNGQYGDFMVVQNLPKEERDKGNKGAILGNGKIIGRSSPQPQPSERRPTATTASRGSAYPPGQKIEPTEKNDVPF
jgi:hypothetical protein